MTSTVEDTPYCRLYIATDEDQRAVQHALDNELSRHARHATIYGSVFKNHGFVAWRGNDYDPIESSRWTAEMDSEASDDAAFEAFEAATIDVVRRLREIGFIVTASCVFEDRVISETGWNWSSDTPVPPS